MPEPDLTVIEFEEVDEIDLEDRVVGHSADESKEIRFSVMKLLSSKGTLCVPTVAALNALDGLPDQSTLLTQGYHSPGDGGENLYKYDKDSIEACDGGFILDGPGGDNSLAATSASYLGTPGVGRFIAVNQFTANAQQYGAKGDRVADDLPRLQALANAAGSSRHGEFVIDGAYFRITNTLVFESLTGVSLRIGNGPFDAGNFKTSSGYWSGIWYDGPAGDGPEPHKCKPAIWFKKLQRASLECVTVAQQVDNAEPYTTGMLFSAGDSIQRGNSRIGELFAGNFERGYVVGLSALPGGLIDHDDTGYSDDVFENTTVDRMWAGGCRHSHFFSCHTSDGSVINNLFAGPYRCGATAPDFGPTKYGIEINHLGNIRFTTVNVVHNNFGDLAHDLDPVAGVNPATDTLTIAGHALANDEIVHLEVGSGSSAPAGLSTDVYYHVVNVSGDDFQLSETQGGDPVGIAADGSGVVKIIRVAGDEAGVFIAAGTVQIDRYSFEAFGAAALREGTTEFSRNGTVLHSFFASNSGGFDPSRTCMEFRRYARLVNCRFTGNVIHRGLDAFSSTFTKGYGFIENSPVQRKHANIFGLVELEDDMPPELAGYGRAEGLHITRAGFLMNEWAAEPISIRTEPTTFTADAATDLLTIGGAHNYSVGDKCVLSTTGALPGGLSAETRYFVVSVSGSEIQLALTEGGGAINITSAGSGTHSIHHAIDIWRQGLLADQGYGITHQTFLQVARSPSTSMAIRSANYMAAMVQSTENEISATFAAGESAFTGVDAGSTAIDLFPALTIETEGAISVIVFSLGVSTNIASFSRVLAIVTNSMGTVGNNRLTFARPEAEGGGERLDHFRFIMST